jgi:modulator of FtsH protease HflK
MKSQVPPPKRSSTSWFLVIPAVILLALSTLVFMEYPHMVTYQVESYERAVLYTLGQAKQEPVAPGFHFKLPPPLQEVVIKNVERDRRIQVGPPQGDSSGQAYLVLTSDANLVNLSMDIHYEIIDLVQYVNNLQQPEVLLQNTAEAAVRSVVGLYSVNEILTEKKAEIAQNVLQALQESLKIYGSGIQINRVQLLRALNPEQVREAFESVESSKQDSSILVEEALSYRNQKLPLALAEANRMGLEAQAYAASRMAQARSEVAIYRSHLQAYNRSSAVTRQRLYLETLEEVLPSTKKFILPESKQNLNLLPLGGSR